MASKLSTEKPVFVDREWTLEDFHFELPEAAIAKTPTDKRPDSRLLVLEDFDITHRKFSDLLDYLHADDLLVLNDTRVMKARLRGRKDSGGRVEILVDRLISNSSALCQVRSSKPLKQGRKLLIASEEVDINDRMGEMYLLEFPSAVVDFLDRFGLVPLPPYIDREPTQSDLDRYQTVYAKSPGAVAAPTAGLHFDETLLKKIEEDGVHVEKLTLHIGAGTFSPVRASVLNEHELHAESYVIPEQTIRAVESCRGRVVAVGTTVMRALESYAQTKRLADLTQLFIRPGFSFRIVDALITNFHLPQSTLLMLVCAFAGYEETMSAYRAAINEGYRFFSYGDSMVCQRRDV